jgi:thymidylate synthase
MYKYKPEMFAQHYDLLSDGRMQYQYGNRWNEFNQLVNTYNRLKQNPNSKRCVVPIFMPYDTAPDRADTPCTTMYHFLHRDGKLNMSVFMRSWDFFGGAKTYDFALSSFVLQALCSWLNLEPGNLCIYANSLHYYNRDRQQLEALVAEAQHPMSNAAELHIPRNIPIDDFYRQLRKVKLIEEHAFARNFCRTNQLKGELSIPLFVDMADTWIRKNENN